MSAQLQQLSILQNNALFSTQYLSANTWYNLVSGWINYNGVDYFAGSKFKTDNVNTTCYTAFNSVITYIVDLSGLDIVNNSALAYIGTGIKAGVKYRSAGGLNYNGVYYGDNQIFIGVDGVTTYTYYFAANAFEIAEVSQLSISFSDKRYYFFENKGTIETITNNGIALHKKMGYTVEINSAGNAQLKAIHGKGAGDILTFNELILLDIQFSKVTARYNYGISVTPQLSGVISEGVAYLCNVVGGTDLSSFTDHPIVAGRPFITIGGGTPTWDGTTSISEIFILDNFRTDSNLP